MRGGNSEYSWELGNSLEFVINIDFILTAAAIGRLMREAHITIVNDPSLTREHVSNPFVMINSLQSSPLIHLSLSLVPFIDSSTILSHTN